MITACSTNGEFLMYCAAIKFVVLVMIPSPRKVKESANLLGFCFKLFLLISNHVCKIMLHPQATG